MTRARSNPEHMLQKQIARFCIYCMPAEVLWTSSMAGQYLSLRQAEINKAKGVRRGFPDMQFLFRGVTYYLELKAPGGRLSPEQREFESASKPFGIFAVARSLEEAEAAFRQWGFPLKSHPFRLDEPDDAEQTTSSS